MDPIHRVSTALNAPAPVNSPEKVKAAAQQFESLMIAELMKTSREASAEGGGWMGTGEDDQTGQNALEMAEQQFASVMSKAGGLGMQTFITNHLLQK